MTVTTATPAATPAATTDTATAPARGSRPLLLANYSEVRGGGEVGVEMLAELLVRRGRHPLVAVPGPGPLARRFERLVLPTDAAAAAQELRHNAARFDLVHAYSGPGVEIAVTAGIPQPILWHVLIPNRFPTDAERFDSCDAVICNSQATANRFLHIGPTTVVYNGVAPPPPSPSSGSGSGSGAGRRSLPVRPGQRTIVVVGPVCPRKGQVDLLPALVEVVARRDDVDALFVGRSWRQPHDPVLTAARRHGPRIRHVEQIPRLAEVLGDASLVVVPSRSEGFGRVAVEAMAAGVPVLARPIEGLLEALHGHVDPWLPEQRERWADRIIDELDRPRHTPDELRSLAARFSPDAFCDGVLQAYAALLASGRWRER